MNDVQRAFDYPFVQIPVDDMQYIMQNCKPTTLHVYLALHVRANKKAGNTCFPSYQKIADDAGVSRRTAINAMEELENEGFVTVEKRMDAEGDQTSNLYWLHRRQEDSAHGSEEPAPQVVQKETPPVVKNLHPNHINPEPYEPEPYNSMREGDILSPHPVDETFEAFWSVYPRRTGKQDARRAWKKLNPDPALLERIGTALRTQMENNWKDRDLQYIPHPATWINGRRWEDQIIRPRTVRRSDYYDNKGNLTLAGVMAQAKGEVI